MAVLTFQFGQVPCNDGVFFLDCRGENIPLIRIEVPAEHIVEWTNRWMGGIPAEDDESPRPQRTHALDVHAVDVAVMICHRDADRPGGSRDWRRDIFPGYICEKADRIVGQIPARVVTESAVLNAD